MRQPDTIAGLKFMDQQQSIVITGDGAEYVGKRLLVGITHQRHDGQLMRKEQFHGLIISAGPNGVVLERADTGAQVLLPPQLQPAEPGEYRLHGTGEIVVDPDYWAKWVQKAPAPDSKEG